MVLRNLAAAACTLPLWTQWAPPALGDDTTNLPIRSLTFMREVHIPHPNIRLDSKTSGTGRDELVVRVDGCAGKDPGPKCCPDSIKECQSAGSALRLHFPDECSLDNGDMLTISTDSPHAPPTTQILNNKSFKQWTKSSAFFNTHKLKIISMGASASACLNSMSKSPSLLGTEVQYTSKPVPVNVPQVQYDYLGIPPDGDTRQVSSHPAVGRLFPPRQTPNGPIFCTAWVANEQRIVTAGHCLDDKKDFRKPLVQFNVPPSNADGGAMQHPDPVDQYPVRNNAKFDRGWKGSERSCPGKAGKDWGILCATRTLPMTPFTADTSLREEKATEVAVIGYGLNYSHPERNFVQQKAASKDFALKAENWCIGHNAVSTPGNSGSPIIVGNKVVGIQTDHAHWHNIHYSGTSFDNSHLRCALWGEDCGLGEVQISCEAR